MLTLESGPARLVVAPEMGGRIVAFSVDHVDLLATPDDDDHNFGCFPMAPWAGRVRHGSFEFEGHRHQLPLNNPPHAIHGTARDQPWSDDGDGVISTSLGPPWPFGGRVVQRFALEPDALRMTMEVHAERPMPAACWHPWWRRAGRGREHLTLETDACAMYRRDDEGMPTGELVQPTPSPWDDCFTQLGNPPARLQWPGDLTVTLETLCACLVVFDEPAHAICVEPQTGPPDAFNLAPVVVQPNEPLVATATWSWHRENG